MATLISFPSYRNIHLSSLCSIIFFLVLSPPKGAELSQSNAEPAVIKQLTVSAGPDQVSSISHFERMFLKFDSISPLDDSTARRPGSSFLFCSTQFDKLQVQLGAHLPAQPG